MTASFDYDLAGRLSQWSSLFRYNDELLADNPVTTYTLDDGGNITRQETTAGPTDTLRSSIDSTFVNSRLEGMTERSFSAAGPETQVTDLSFDYSGLGEEISREAVTTVAGQPPR